MIEDEVRFANAAGCGKHPSVGGVHWGSDTELGAKARDILGHFIPLIAPYSPETHGHLLVELAGKLYDNLASALIERVRAGHMQDAIDFETNHAVIADMAVWQVLKQKGFIWKMPSAKLSS